MNKQISVFKSEPVADKVWLGLGTDHRRLFTALQDGWLRPAGEDIGILVGAGAYAFEKSVNVEGNRIPVRMKLAMKKLPTVDVHVLRGKDWISSDINGIVPQDRSVYWPGALPTFAISEIFVSTEEERVRLINMARLTSNIILPERVIAAEAKLDECFEADNVPPAVAVSIDIPDTEDAIHGAINMAVWGVPRIDPWMDVLTASLIPGKRKLHSFTKKVEATWWRFPPWMPRTGKERTANAQEKLWLAAVDIFQRRVLEGSLGNPFDLAEEITRVATKNTRGKSSKAVRTWLQATQSILRAESTVQLENWRSCPVGIAIQLVLTRPEPTTFKTWFKDKPELPPGVAWSAAALCGLLHGYKGLDAQFRGDELQREFLSIHALHLCKEKPRVTWPSHRVDSLEWRREDDNDFVLSWNGTDFFHKHGNRRGKWYVADFEGANIKQQALMEAEKLNWPCLQQEIRFANTQLSISGSGKVSLSAESGRDQELDIQGEARMRLPENCVIEDTLNIEEFRRFVAVESGVLSHPVSDNRIPQDNKTEVPGLMYIRDFITESEEKVLVSIIDKNNWCNDLKRRVQHYGWRYDYDARRIDSSMKLGLLPDWASKIAQRLYSEKLVPALPDQVIVNEYKGNQGISKHADSESFADGIATISLLESWEMWFRNIRSKTQIKKITLEKRSVAIMSGDARYNWTHEIRNRKREPVQGKRERRISLTFRRVRTPGGRSSESG